jgi:hypothetical protein
MALISGSRMADDVATRFEVTTKSEDGDGVSLGQLFNTLSCHNNTFITDYNSGNGNAGKRVSKVIRENMEKEDNDRRHRS